ncbi:ATP-binding protein [Cellulomonas fimi]|uniref:ATP-binding protein n=1 Tax=Cellulomonas fimi TaxID=1708 RepID=A0A7Y0M114_CELFI|nr:SbcC/MukB-like Walker B domain-containing protein [Cellulomonas fimi]NMR20467.1 hypothetical protein [Cellulomonas fimi]
MTTPSTTALFDLEESTSASPRPAEPIPGAVHPGQWRLERIEVVNWGTFHGHHAVDVARQGFLLTGHSGSGKSSLVDAVSAVLTPPGKIRFNAAAADAGGRADRTFAAYVRGAWRRQTDDATGEVVSDYLRTGATWSGVALRFADGTGGAGGVVTLVKLFHLRAGENANPSDLHVLLPGALDLLDLQPFARDGLQARAIKAEWPQATVTDKHSQFAARFCRVLGIHGDNALLLLHKTQSAKNLGSLDDLFRGFMLDEPTTFGLAETAVAQFTELDTAHRHVVTARRQVEHLTPLRALAAEHAGHEREVDDRGALLAALPAFADAWQLELARHDQAQRSQQAAALTDALDEARRVTREREGELRDAELLVAQHGGSAVVSQQARVDAADARVTAVQAARTSLAERLGEVELALPATAAEYEELRSLASAERHGLEESRAAERDERHRLYSTSTRARQTVETLDRELDALKRVRSNLDGDLLRARQLVCHATGLAPDLLPFAGELLRVADAHAEWAGPIERVLRPLATVMLVPALHRDAVARAVDAHHLRARIVFEVVPARVDAPRLVGGPGSLVHRVEVKDGPFRAWLAGTLSRQYDVECVAGDAELHGVERGVTRAGLVKRGSTRHEKDDRFAVDDRARWVLGFDNADKVEHLLARRASAQTELDAAEREIERADRQARAAQDRRAALRAVEDREWREVDLAGAEQELDRARGALAEILAASADLRTAQAAAGRAREAVGAARDAEQQALAARAEASSELDRLDRLVADLSARPIEPVAPSHHAELEDRFYRQQRSVRYDVVHRVQSQVQSVLQSERETAGRAAARAAERIIGVQAEFKHTWPALAGDLTDALADRDGYLAVLGRLETDRLPEFEERFFGLLQTQSQRNIGQLAAVIRRAPGEIRDKIVPINTSLRRSPFDRGRFLQIKVDENRTAAAHDFLADLREISTGSWADEDRAAAERRFAVMARVMARLGSSEHGDRSWRALCLDTRRHVRFTGVEVDPGGTQVNVHDSAAGLSGGQRQKLVVFCLAAALRYQLTPPEAEIPAYGTIILDEAFDKADSTFTRMAMDVFVEFGFHMVLATPLKLLQTLEEYVGGVGLATCRDFRESRVGLVAFDDVPVPEDRDA